MKKTYISPKIKVHKLHISSGLMVTSQIESGGGDGNIGGDTEEAGAKGMGLWEKGGLWGEEP